MLGELDTDQLVMTQKERDRLVALKKAKKKLITQKEAAAEIGVSERQVRRMLRSLKERGDKAVIHAARGRRSNRKIAASVKKEAIEILSQEVYQGFGPTLAAEYLAKKHKLEVSRETLRSWMTGAKLWRAQAKRIEKVHTWRTRRSRLGELVQLDTSEHDWLEGRGPKLYLISMIDDATSRMLARFVESDSTAENMRLLQSYLELNGRPVSFYTDKAALFTTTPKTKRGELAGKDRAELAPTQIGRSLKELDIEWIAAHSPQAKGRVERGFGTAQDRLVKGLRVGPGRDARTSQCLPGERVPGVVEPDAHGQAGPCRQCASPLGQRAFSRCQSQSCRDAAGGQRLHHPLRDQAVSDSARRRSSWVAWRHGARGTTTRRHAGDAVPRSVSDSRRMFTASQSCSSKIIALAQNDPAQERLDAELPRRQERRPPQNLNAVGWAKIAQPSSRSLYAKPPLQSFTKSKTAFQSKTLGGYLAGYPEPRACRRLLRSQLQSHRPCIFSNGATPPRINYTLTRTLRWRFKIGHFYFAEIRTFLLCVDRRLVSASGFSVWFQRVVSM